MQGIYTVVGDGDALCGMFLEGFAAFVREPACDDSGVVCLSFFSTSIMSRRFSVVAS